MEGGTTWAALVLVGRCSEKIVIWGVPYHFGVSLSYVVLIAPIFLLSSFYGMT